MTQVVSARPQYAPSQAPKSPFVKKTGTSPSRKSLSGGAAYQAGVKMVRIQDTRYQDAQVHLVQCVDEAITSISAALDELNRAAKVHTGKVPPSMLNRGNLQMAFDRLKKVRGR